MKNRLYMVAFLVRGQSRAALVRSRDEEEAKALVEHEYFANIENVLGLQIKHVQELESERGLIWDVPYEAIVEFPQAL